MFRWLVSLFKAYQPISYDDGHIYDGNRGNDEYEHTDQTLAQIEQEVNMSRTKIETCTAEDMLIRFITPVKALLLSEAAFVRDGGTSYLSPQLTQELNEACDNTIDYLNAVKNGLGAKNVRMVGVYEARLTQSEANDWEEYGLGADWYADLIEVEGILIYYEKNPSTIAPEEFAKLGLLKLQKKRVAFNKAKEWYESIVERRKTQQ